MLPTGYQLPAAIVLLLTGTLACFTGYRLFRTVLAVYGFIFGALIASSLVAASNTTGMLAAALGGGVAGALLLLVGYFLGIALAGAGLGAVLMHVAWEPLMKADPPAAAVIVISVIGAIAAMWLQRYVVIVSTAFAGAWTLVVGAMLVVASRGAKVSGDAQSWILYPIHPAPEHAWVPLAWIGVALVGAIVQLGGKGRRR